MKIFAVLLMIPCVALADFDSPERAVRRAQNVKMIRAQMAEKASHADNADAEYLSFCGAEEDRLWASWRVTGRPEATSESIFRLNFAATHPSCMDRGFKP